MKIYYIYRHIRNDKNVPFYIGKGTKVEKCVDDKVVYRRAFSSIGRNKIWNRITSRTDYTVEIIFETNDKNMIDKKEIEFIALYGRIHKGTGTLANLTAGGDGQYDVPIESVRNGVIKRFENGSYIKTADVNSRPVSIYRADGTYIKTFKSKRACAKELHINVSIVFTGIKQKRMFVGVFFSNEQIDKIDITKYKLASFNRKKQYNESLYA